MASAETKCTKCERLIGISEGFAPFDDLCGPCTGRPCKQCAKCEVTFADIGSPDCPFCHYFQTRSV